MEHALRVRSSFCLHIENSVPFVKFGLSQLETTLLDQNFGLSLKSITFKEETLVEISALGPREDLQ